VVKSTDQKTIGLRETKSRELRSRIAKEGLRLFGSRGYDETKLETVAEAAGVAPRTLYHYFKTKYEILLFFHDDSFVTAIDPMISLLPVEWGPFRIARECLLELVPRYETKTMVATYRIWNSTDALIAQKQLMFLQIEETIFSSLQKIWPLSEYTARLRLASMVATAALRLAMEASRREMVERPVKVRLKETFETLENLVTSSTAA
jgi:AcrR family transcriptional regulator